MQHQGKVILVLPYSRNHCKKLMVYIYRIDGVRKKGIATNTSAIN